MDAVTTAKIADSQITVAKMTTNSVDSDQYVDGSIDTAHIASAQVTADKIGTSAVTTAKINADAITSAKIADEQIDSEHYVDGSIDTVHIADSQITVAKMAANSVDSDQYVDGSIDTAHIADSQITSAKIVDGTIVNADINASAAIDATKIADGTVTNSEFQYINTLSSNAQTQIDAKAATTYVDNAVAGLRTRIIAECASTANVVISSALEAGDVIDGVTLVAGDRVLLKDQSTATENGLYLAVASGAASRDPEHDTIAELSGGMVVVNQGTANDNKIFLCTTDTDATLGSTSITYTTITPQNVGTVTSITAGTGLSGGAITSSGTIAIDTATTVDKTTAQTLTNKTLTSPKINEDVAVTSTATELNLLDGVSGLVQADFTKLAAIDATAAEIDTLDGLSRGSIIYGNASAATTVLTKGTVGQVLTSDGTDIAWGDAASGLEWQSSIVTAATITVTANKGYWINTTSNACTITLPASASVGDTIEFSDYSRTWGTNAVTINQNSLNFQGFSSPNPVYDTDGQSVRIVYSGATQGWIPTVDDDVTDEVPQTYDIDFLVIAGGASGGTYSAPSGYAVGNNGSNSSISGTGLTTITSAGGGGGGAYDNQTAGNGGSGGGGGTASPRTTVVSGGLGNTPSTSPSQGNNGGTGGGNAPFAGGGGGGGAGAVGGNNSGSVAGNGGNGLASSITGSSVTRAGGGGGAANVGTQGSGGTGGGGAGANSGSSATAGTVNTGSGGGAGDSGGGAGHGGGGAGGYRTSTQTVTAGNTITATVGDGGSAVGLSGAGGKGVVILSMPDADYSGTTTGSPTVATGVSGKTVLTFTGSGSYTS
jgi:mucin-19